MCSSYEDVYYDKDENKIKGFESYWHIGMKWDAWVKVWESRDKHKAISVVPIPEKGAKSKKPISFSDIEGNGRTPNILLTIGLNPRSYKKKKGIEDIDDVYKMIIDDHNKYYEQYCEQQKKQQDERQKGGNLDRTRSRSIGKFDYLRTVEESGVDSDSVINELMQIDVFPFRTYEANDKALSSYVDNNKEIVDDAVKETIKAIERYSEKAKYIFLAWGQEANSFLRSHQDYAMKLRDALSASIKENKVYVIDKEKAYPLAVQRQPYAKWDTIDLSELNRFLGLDGSEKE